MVKDSVKQRRSLKKWALDIFGKNAEQRVFNIINYVLFTLFTLIMLAPFIYVLVVSFQQKAIVNDVSVNVFGIGAYKHVLGNPNILRAFLNTIGTVLIGTAFAVCMTMLGAYPLSKKHMRGRGFLLVYVLITMLFSGGLIPFYLLIKNLGLGDSYLVYIVIGALGAFNIFIVKNFYQGIPVELEEAAKIDGANEFQVFFRVYLPLSKSIMATIALWISVGKWNDYMTGLLYIDSPQKLLIQNILRDMLVTASTTSGTGADAGMLNLSESIKMATVVIAMVPIMCVYPFVQKYFTKGVIMGSVKG